MTEPPVLFRSVDGVTLENYARGIVWFRSPRYFRSLEDKIRADPLEGIGSYQVGDGVLVHDVSDNDNSAIHPAFILSFSETPLEERYGEHVLKFDEPLELKRYIEKKLPTKNHQVEVTLREVAYGKTMQLESHPSPTEDWDRKYFSKPEEFAYEKEWRLFIMFVHSFPILNDTLKLRLSGLRRFYQYFNGQTDS